MTIEVGLDGRVGAFRLQARFAVPSTGTTVLLGPSGSGKTTLLRAMAGLVRVAGSIRVAGRVWQDDRLFLRPEKRRIGYVFQGAGLLPHLSVAANLDYAERRAPAGAFNRTDLIASTGIGNLLKRRPDELSGGEAQRASIARALLSQPRLLLMDEPLTALDSAIRHELLDWLEEMFARIDIPIFYVTHDDGEAQRLAVRIVRLHDGRALHEG